MSLNFYLREWRPSENQWDDRACALDEVASAVLEGRLSLTVTPEDFAASVRALPVHACVFDANITHNLSAMAVEAGIYACLWRPEENGITKASQIIEPLTAGLSLMKADPERFKKHDSPNGWGLYQNFVPWLERVLEACTEQPHADVSVSR